MKGRGGLAIAGAALAVSAPRLVLAFLSVDGLAMPANWEAGALAATGVATGVVLTWGGAYLAGTLAAVPEASALRALLVGCWLAVLAASALLIAPMLVSGVRRTALADVLGGGWGAWLWAVVAVLAVELVAAGALAAQHLRHRRASELASLTAEHEALRRRHEQLQSEMHRLVDQASLPAVAAPSELPCPLGCGQTYRSRQAVAAHSRHCPQRGGH